MELFIFITGGLAAGFVAGLAVGKRQQSSRFGVECDCVSQSHAMMAGAAPAFEAEDEELMGEAREAVQTRIDKRLARIVEQAKAAGRITNDGVEDLFCISDRTASNYLRTLADDGRLKRQGVGRGTYYTPTK